MCVCPVEYLVLQCGWASPHPMSSFPRWPYKSEREETDYKFPYMFSSSAAEGTMWQDVMGSCSYRSGGGGSTLLTCKKAKASILQLPRTRTYWQSDAPEDLEYRWGHGKISLCPCSCTERNTTRPHQAPALKDPEPKTHINYAKTSDSLPFKA